LFTCWPPGPLLRDAVNTSSPAKFIFEISKALFGSIIKYRDRPVELRMELILIVNAFLPDKFY